MALRALCESAGTTVASVFRLVIEGSLHIDWWEPLDLESKSEHHAGRPLDLAFSVRGKKDVTERSAPGHQYQDRADELLNPLKVHRQQLAASKHGNCRMVQIHQFTEDEPLYQFIRNELVFERSTADQHPGNQHSSLQLDRALAMY